MIKLKLGQDKLAEGGAKLPPGRYQVRVEKVLVKPSRNPRTPGDKVVIEFDVLKVYNKTEPYKNWDGNSLMANVGDRRSYVIDLARGDIALSNATKFTMAACGVDPRDQAAIKNAKGPDGRDMNATNAEGDSGWSLAFCSMQGPDNPVRGVVLDVEAYPHVTAGDKTIMIHEWSPTKEVG